MNCQRFQDLLEEYLDDSLSTAKQAAAEQHLAKCAACRAALQRRRQIGRTLSDGFHQLTRPLELQPKVQQRLLNALVTPSTARERRFLPWFSGRLAWPLTAAACFLVVAFVLSRHFTGPQNPAVATNPSPGHVPAVMASIQVSYPVTAYTFQKEGSFVRDTLVYQTVVVNGRLPAEQSQKAGSKN
jgi:anti-sigma factor RsiW